jgi:hypothetical protein
MLWKSNPASAELEEVTLDWVRQMVGLSENFWGIIYDLLETMVPGSYTGILLESAPDITVRFQHFQYFSFVTLTTLGYGDILPQNEGAAALCQTEAIIGQFFMAVLVARLVGIQVSQQFSSENTE